MPRLVRRKPLLERIKANLDPVDWFFTVTEVFDSSDLEIGRASCRERVF